MLKYNFEDFQFLTSTIFFENQILRILTKLYEVILLTNFQKSLLFRANCLMELKMFTSV